MKFFLLSLFIILGLIIKKGRTSPSTLTDILTKTTASRFCSRDLSSLRQLIVVMRNGDSSPDFSFVNDIHPEVSWPNGFSQLTKRGIERTFEVGTWTRQCYDNFLHKTALNKRIFARSADADQTLMSAEAYLAGAYPPLRDFQLGYQTWGDTMRNPLGQLWQPIPVHSVEAYTDTVLLGHENCPRFKELADEINFAEKTTEILWKDFDFLNTVAKKSCSINSTDLLSAVIRVSNAVLTQVENGRTPVAWLSDEETLTKLAHYRDLAVDLYANNAEWARITSGMLLQEIINRLIVKSLKSSPIEHVLYSAQTHTIEGLLGSLGVLKINGNRKPPYGSAVIFELHQEPDCEVYRVVTYYRNSSVADPMELAIPGCSNFGSMGCSLDDFRQALATKASRNHEQDCKSKKIKEPTTTPTLPTLPPTQKTTETMVAAPRRFQRYHTNYINKKLVNNMNYY